MDRRAVVLVSGGLDSATTLAIALSEGRKPFALSFDYGQRHHRELQAAERVVASMGGCEHRCVRVDLGRFGGSALTDQIDVPKHDTVDGIGAGTPVTYVPARNTVFLSLALAWAEALEAFDIYIGVNALDYSGYPDCRPEFIAAFETMANLATEAAVSGKGRFTIHAPLMRMTKGQIIRRGAELGVDFGLTHSCYDPSPQGLSCGRCDSCLLRLKGFEEAGLRDPLTYAIERGPAPWRDSN